MIVDIKSLKNFGIYKDSCSPDGVSFQKYNLIFGSNGVGKSTLSELFRCLEKRHVSGQFKNSEFTLTNSNQEQISHKTLSKYESNVFVFNKNFVEENIDWNQTIKKILLIDEGNISGQKKLKISQSKREEALENLFLSLADAQQKEKKASDFYSSTAKLVKETFLNAGVDAIYYSNFNKSNVEDFIEKHKAKWTPKEHLLSEEARVKILKSLGERDFAEINANLKYINAKEILDNRNSIQNLIKRSPSSRAIELLINNSDLQNWVGEGLDIHRKIDGENCQFCGAKIQKERMAELESHFDKSYRDYIKDLREWRNKIADASKDWSYLPKTIDINPELSSQYSSSLNTISSCVESINTTFDSWIKLIDEKIENPYSNVGNPQYVTNQIIELHNNTLDLISEIIQKHNCIERSRSETLDKNKKTLESHLIYERCEDFQILEVLRDISGIYKKVEALKVERVEIDYEIEKIQTEIASESVGSQEFNRSLHEFLGRSDISIIYNSSKKGYEILRNGKVTTGTTLSEGEKTAMAVVYFAMKVKEGKRENSETIIVIDDPISSLDSNNLFYSYSFIKSHCEESSQLFVLTHNFGFFKLVRNWFKKKNKKGKRNSEFFEIVSNSGLPRSSEIKMASKSLLDYESEYHYIFEKLYSLKNENLTLDSAYFSSNLARKLLEAFLSFKYPKKRGDFMSLLEAGVSESSSTTDTIKEKLYRFINRYSHSDSITVTDESSENIMGETTNMILDIFNLVQDLDENHYNEMVEVCSCQP